MVEYYELRQRNVLEKTSFQDFQVKTFADGFREFYFALQQVHLSTEHVILLEGVECQLRYSILPFKNWDIQFFYL